MITIKADYTKKIGLPGYSSHQFSVSLTTELTDLSQVEQESAKLYAKLQQSVDSSKADLPGAPVILNIQPHIAPVAREKSCQYRTQAAQRQCVRKQHFCRKSLPMKCALVD